MVVESRFGWSPRRKSRGHVRIIDRLVRGVGKIGQSAEVVVERAVPERTRGAGATGVLPLRFGRQRESHACLLGEPLTEGHGLIPRDTNDRLLGTIQMMTAFVIAELVLFAGLQATVVVAVETGILSIADLQPRDPEGLVDGDQMSGSLVGVAVL